MPGMLHIYTNASSFIKKDKLCFEKIGTVAHYEFHVPSKIMLPYSLLKQALYLLFRGWKTRIFICQFAGYHSFLPCLFAFLTRRKSIIIACGTDCVSFPGIRYGFFYRPILRDFTRWSYRLCTVVCPKHETLWYTRYDYDVDEPREQGIKAFIPGLNKRVEVINNGYDPEQWPLLPIARKPKSFITVSGAFEYEFQVQLKGIDLILKIAPEFPDCSFTIVGVPDWKKLDIQSANVSILPPQPQAALSRLFNEHSYYLQLSMAEGFPNALCEAMLSGCTPVVSNVFSMPEIVDEYGYILKKRDTSELKNLLMNLLGKEEINRELIRGLIKKKYTFNERKNKFLHLLKIMLP